MTRDGFNCDSTCNCGVDGIGLEDLTMMHRASAYSYYKFEYIHHKINMEAFGQPHYPEWYEEWLKESYAKTT